MHGAGVEGPTCRTGVFRGREANKNLEVDAALVLVNSTNSVDVMPRWLVVVEQAGVLLQRLRFQESALELRGCVCCEVINRSSVKVRGG